MTQLSVESLSLSLAKADSMWCWSQQSGHWLNYLLKAFHFQHTAAWQLMLRFTRKVFITEEMIHGYRWWWCQPGREGRRRCARLESSPCFSSQWLNVLQHSLLQICPFSFLFLLLPMTPRVLAFSPPLIQIFPFSRGLFQQDFSRSNPLSTLPPETEIASAS